VKTLELGVMIIGGAASISSPKAMDEGKSAPAATASEEAATPMEGIEKVTSPPPAQGPSGQEMLQTDDFWDDLKGFLEQRLKDEGEASRLKEVFRGAWKSSAG